MKSRFTSISVHLRLSAAVFLCGCSSPPARPPEPSPAVVSPAPAGAPSRPASVVLSVDPWEFNGRSGKLIRTSWYRLFTTETDPALVDGMPGFLEAALENYTTTIAVLPRPAMKLDTFLMATRPQWVSLTQQVMGSSAATYLRIERGGFAAGGRALLWSIGPRDTLAIAAHEGWHQYTQRTFKQWLPAWLEEGIATYMEGFVPDPREPGRPIFLGWANVERFDQLRAAAAGGRLIPLEDLLGMSPQDLIDTSTERTLTYYAQVWALTHFLREGEDGKHRASLAMLTADAANGRLEKALAGRHGSQAAHRIVLSRGGPAVFRAYFNEDLEGAGEEYARFVDRVVSGSRERIVAGRSPVGP